MLARAARLGGGAREVLDVAALIGARVELRLLMSVTASPPSAMDELLASGLLAGDGGWLKFRHEIARLAVEEAVALHRRADIHARILAALGRWAATTTPAWRFTPRRHGYGPAVLRHAPPAARQAAELGSHREAAAQYERALRFAADADPHVRRAV